MRVRKSIQVGRWGYRQALVLVLGIASGAWSHGLMVTPPSRMWYCGVATKPNETNAGTAKYPECKDAFAVNPDAAYNYMAVVTHTLGRSFLNPLPKNVCGFDGEFWKGAKTPWDAAMEWPTTPATAGPLAITWDVTLGPHFDDTQDFRYWITKPGFVFSPTKELTWDDFETEAFCVLNYVDTKPFDNPNVIPDKTKSTFATQCQLPARTGHHVIYGEWGRTPPTLERFHGCIDLVFNSSPIISGPLPRGGKLDGMPTQKVDVLGRSNQKSTRKFWILRP